jgi:hypothetical protein
MRKTNVESHPGRLGPGRTPLGNCGGREFCAGCACLAVPNPLAKALAMSLVERLQGSGKHMLNLLLRKSGGKPPKNSLFYAWPLGLDTAFIRAQFCC